MLSNVEYKLIIVFFALILLFSAVRTSDFVVFSYNRSVESWRNEKIRLANNQEKIEFSGCNPCTSDPYETIIPFQIVLLAFAFGGLIVRNTGSIIASTLILLSIVYGYFDWMLVTYKIVAGSEYYNYYGNSSLKSHFLLNSSALDFVLLFSVFVLLSIQSGIIVRFAAERIRLKLNLDDQTSRTRP